MTLRRKTLMTVGIVFIGLVIILYFISQTLLMRSFTQLEEQRTRQNVEQALNALSNDILMLKMVTYDWAVWDDTYAFIEDVNQNYIQANLVAGTFTELRLSFMLFINSSGRMVYSKAFDLHSRKEMAVPQSLLSYLTPGNLLVSHSDPQSIISGIILLPENPMLIVSYPILTSEEKGPIRGALIIGRYLDSSETERLAQQTRLSLTIHRYDYSPMPGDFQAVLPSLSQKTSVLVRPLDEQSIAGYALIRDVYNKPILLLRVDMPRDIYAQGQATVSYFILSLLGIGVVLGVVMMLFLDKQVLSRLTGLSQNVGNIGISGDLSVRVPATGKDELSNLGVAINVMVETLEQSSDILQRKNKQLDVQAKDLQSYAEELQSEITERKRAEESTRKSEELYRSLFENMLNGFAYCKMLFEQDKPQDFVYLSVNSAFEDLTGLKNVAGKKVSEVIQGIQESDPELFEIYGRVALTGIPERFETYLKALGMWLSISVYSPGKEYFVAVFDVITERKQAGEALRVSEERLRNLIENAPVGITVSTPEGRILEMNQARLVMAGYDSKEEYISMPISERYYDPRDRERWIALLREKGKVEGFEVRFKRKDGTSYWSSMASIPQITESGEQQFIVVTQDITERKQAEELYRTLAESSPVGVYIFQDGKFQFANIEFQKFSGFSQDELLKMAPFELIYPEDRRRARENAVKMLKGNLLSPYEFRIIHQSGETRWTMETVASIYYKGKRATLGNFMDITERKQMERELQVKNEQLDAQNKEFQLQADELIAQRQRLIEKTREVEKANQLKSEFLSNMSHELRTPLNAIIGFSELMADEVPGKINQEQRQCLTDVLTSSRHLLNLINEVLDLARIESGKVELKPENVALTKVIKSLTRTMIPILTPRKQSLDVEIEEGLHLVYADEGRLAQVLLNLVDNASKYTPDGGKLKIEVVREGDWCRVSIIDSGIGINKKDQEGIFEPFSRLEGPLVEERGGTGLGLALVKQVVERYGGRIWVESEYEKGSKFSFTLPLATSGQPNAEERG